MKPKPGATLRTAAGTAGARTLSGRHVAAMGERRRSGPTGAPGAGFGPGAKRKATGVLPAPPGTVATYLVIRAAREAGPATIRMDRAAHLQAGARTPPASPASCGGW